MLWVAFWGKHSWHPEGCLRKDAESHQGQAHCSLPISHVPLPSSWVSSFLPCGAPALAVTVLSATLCC